MFSRICLTCCLYAFITKHIHGTFKFQQCYCVDYSGYSLCLSTNGASDGKTWQGSRNACVSSDSKLVNVNSSHVQSALVDLKVSIGIANAGNWIGISASRPPLSFRWIDGRNASVPATLDGSGVNTTQSRLFAFINNVSYVSAEWYKQCYYICQTTGPCSHDDMVQGDICYKEFLNYSTWYQASNLCLLSERSMLATFDDSQPAKTLISWLNDSTNCYWIGLTNTWWISETGEDALFTDWQLGQPMPSQSGDDCVIILNNDPGNRDQWAPLQCSEQQSYVCQTYRLNSSCLPPPTTATVPTTTVAIESDRISFSTLTSSAASTPMSDESQPRTDRRLVIGLVVGIGGGLLLIIAVIVVIVALLYKKRKASHSDAVKSGNFRQGTNNHTATGADAHTNPFPVYAEVDRSKRTEMNNVKVVYAQVIPQGQGQKTNGISEVGAESNNPVVYADVVLVPRTSVPTR